MKNLLPLLICVCAALNLSAQPVLTAQWSPTPGQNYVMHVCEPCMPLPLPGPGGENQTWSFAIANFVEEEAGFVQPAATPYAADFPLSTLSIREQQPLRFTYFIATDTALMDLGDHGDDGLRVWEKPQRFLRFPLAFGDAWTDSSKKVFNGGIAIGTTQNTCDGWGTIVVNGQTYNDVVRVRRNIQRDIVYDDGTVSGGNGQSWEWFSMNHPGMRLFAIFKNNDGTMRVETSESKEATFVETADAEGSVALSPSLAESGFTQVLIRARNAGAVAVDVYDAVGRLVAKQDLDVKTGSNAFELQTSGFSKGLYFVRVHGSGLRETRKLIVR